ncbi:dihydropteroate synthase [Neisseriaceae bacterium ESL0693]|nr:dihydropteroate synthase [Neisseriaceae bacterium ESL0693]
MINKVDSKTGSHYWQCGRYQLDLSQPRIMGIVNLTPDSFSDGGCYSHSTKSALQHAEQLLHEGADILDIGGESTRPGADPVTVAEEWRRIEPVLRELRTWHVPLSVDTRRTEVMRQLLEHQLTDAINDVQGLEAPGAVALLAQKSDIGVCLMHMRGQPQDMQSQTDYDDVAETVGQYLSARVQACIQAGIARERLLVDPGFGFAKTLQHHIELMQKWDHWQQLAGCPVLAGLSRKGSIGKIIQEPIAAQRVTASVVAAVAAVAHGAAIVRVHDVLATRQGLQIWSAFGV